MTCMKKYNLNNTFHLSQTLTSLSESVADDLLCDVSIVCSDGIVRCSSFIIAAVSQHLHTILLSVPSSGDSTDYTLILDGFYKHQVEQLLCRHLFNTSLEQEYILNMMDLINFLHVDFPIINILECNRKEDNIIQALPPNELDEFLDDNNSSIMNLSHKNHQKRAEDTVLTFSDLAGSRCCLPCTKVFKTKKEYKQHFQRKHVFGKQFPCKIDGCEKLFKTNFELKIHEKSHSNAKDFICSYCNLQYKTKSTLDIHIKRKHQNKDKEEQYPCEECGNTFRLLVDLKTHISNVHKAKIMPKNTCNLCNKSFSLKAHLQEHILIHTGQKPYKCDHCSAEFRTNSNLKKHIKVHTGVKDNVCTFCNKGFGRSDHLKNHVSKHHRNPTELKESENVSKQPISVGDSLTMIEIPEADKFNDNQQSDDITYVFTF